MSSIATTPLPTWQKRYLTREDEVHNVCIFGGTHGNEKTAFAVADHYLCGGVDSGCHRDTFTTLVEISNPASVEANTRYVDTDMNRCFLAEDLNNRDLTQTVEHRRAKELNQLYGPKDAVKPKVDYLIDLHNTTANCGILLLFHPSDTFSHMIGKHLIENSGCDIIRCCAWPNSERPNAGTLGRSGMTFEVGPSPWGCVNTELMLLTKKLVEMVLDFIEQHNISLANNTSNNISIKQKLVMYKRVGQYDYPRDNNSNNKLYNNKGRINMYIHPNIQDKDFKIRLIHGETKIFLDCNGKESATFDFNKMVQVPNANIDVNKDELYPFFINEAAYYEKGFGFAVGKKCIVEF
eukprot:g4349.t1